MSLLTNYEGLRHQIERLVRENEELKKLVRLIRENHELKSAIKTQAGALGLSGFSSGLGEASTGPTQRQGVFLSPAPAAANEPALDEVGLAPMADMLNSPQPSPISMLLSSLGPMSQNSALYSLLANPMATSMQSAMASSLGLPSTGSLTPHGHLSGSMRASPAATLTSSLGLPSTGSLTPSSPLVGPLFTSTTAPPGVSQNLANPATNVEAPRVRLAESPQGPASGPHPSAGAAGPAVTRKIPLSTEHPLPTQDPESFSMTFVGGPIQTSTPVGAVGTPGSANAFSFSTSEAQTQPGAPQGPAAAVLVPTTPATPAIVLSAPDPAPAAATNHSPSNTAHIAQGTTHSGTRVNPSSARPSATSPPRYPHSPPRTASSPASVNGPRGSETARKSILDLERKLAHRKTSKFPESPREPKQLALERLVGEIAFQLDRRILSSIFPERVRLYGFTVSNIPEKIIQASLNPNDHKLDEELCQTLTQRYVSIMNRLQSLGYNGRVHPALTEQLVNAYGILRERPELAVSEGGSYTVDFLQRVLVETVHPSMLTDALLLLSCLSQLAHDDGKPMFIW
ncbi:speriolin isoform X2 [Myotis myotis]|uniref:Spermatogenesis and centriole associated 1 n=1 Tax=Myotis myotis TaxID=51298 RepID=A0A7J7R414_MYOMY|nr:speriolin isoform X2 [Myotis myotis]KAF6270890.1 spermatogenesis and centriole associated 1 [Myotis myotis]